MSSAIYKYGQGYWTRVGTVIGLGLLAVAGGTWVHDNLAGAAWVTRVGNPIYISWGAALAFCALCAVGIWWITARNAGAIDFFCATEAEMKKMNWSTKRELFGSTAVVILLSLLLALLCFIFDRVFFLLFVQLKVLDPGT